jgi:hypothetical protein
MSAFRFPGTRAKVAEKPGTFEHPRARLWSSATDKRDTVPVLDLGKTPESVTITKWPNFS